MALYMHPFGFRFVSLHVSFWYIYGLFHGFDIPSILLSDVFLRPLLSKLLERSTANDPITTHAL